MSLTRLTALPLLGMLHVFPASGFLPLELVLSTTTFVPVSSSQNPNLQKFPHLLISLFAVMSECSGNNGGVRTQVKHNRMILKRLA